MPENPRLSQWLDEIDVNFVEGEETPHQYMMLSIHLYPIYLLFSNTVSILELFGVERTRSTVYKWVHKADLQPKSRRSPDHVVVDETVIRLNDQQYWLYAAVDHDTNDLLHTTLEPTRNNVFAHTFLRELREKHDIDDAVFRVDGSLSLQNACSRHGF